MPQSHPIPTKHNFYFRSSAQFRPLRKIGMAPYQTSKAAGTRIRSHFVPTKNAAIPKRMRAIDPPVDLNSALMLQLLNSFLRSEFLGQ
jgi:hypothetical protein